MKYAKINIKEHKIEIFWEEKQKAVAPAAYSGGFRPGIPTEAGHPIRCKAATYSDVKPATFGVASDWVAGIKRNKNFI